jgi:futalosine hydrolase
MTCLLVAATAFEIAPFLDYYRETSNRRSNPPEIDVLISGIGLAASTYAITKQLQIKKPDLVIQAGIGGGFNKNIPLGSVVVVKQEVVGDQAVIENGQLKTMFDLGLTSKNQFPFSNSRLINKSGLLKKVKLKKVNGITTNEITTSQQKIKLYRDRFDPAIESLEGAALHYVCLMEKIEFLQVRSVSNYIGERNKKKWRLNESITNLNKELTRLLESF